MLYVKQKLIENRGQRHFESLSNYKEVIHITKKLRSQILPSRTTVIIGNGWHLNFKCVQGVSSFLELINLL